jgi:hypothetical protein
MGNYLHAAVWLVGQVDDVAGANVEIEGNARVGGGLDAGKTQDEARGAVADKFGRAVEQFPGRTSSVRRSQQLAEAPPSRLAILRHRVRP